MRTQKIFIKSRFWWSFLLLALIATGCNTQPKKEEKQAEKKQQYRCPMHPDIIGDKPGNCPICGMNLVAFSGEQKEIKDVNLNTLLRPTNSYVLSSVPVTTMQKQEVEIKVEALGTVEYDTRDMAAISARVSGRIEKLYLKYTFQEVEKGQKIMDIYSPELLTAQQNLLFLITNDPENISFINSAKEKLLLLGMSIEQLHQVISSGKPAYTVSVYSGYDGHIHDALNSSMILSTTETTPLSSQPLVTRELKLKEGMWVQKGQTMVTVMNPHHLWAVLNIFGADQILVKTGNPVTIVPESDTNKIFNAKVDFIEPFFREGAKTLAVRAYFENHTMDMPVGSQVKASISVNRISGYWLPKDAILSLGLNKIVFKNYGGVFRAHKIETGLTYHDKVQIFSGLNPDDPVATNAQYLMDSESFIKVNE